MYNPAIKFININITLLNKPNKKVIFHLITLQLTNKILFKNPLDSIFFPNRCITRFHINLFLYVPYRRCPKSCRSGVSMKKNHT